MNGDKPFGGTLPIAVAGPPRHIAVPTPRVRVGVTKIRRKLAAEPTPKTHPALFIVQTKEF